MPKLKVGIPAGTRDFSAEVVRKREFIIGCIKQVFELYGFQPLETPAFENLETLLGKYGEEGDRLIFKILNNGLSDPANKQKARLAFDQVIEGKNDPNLTERALRYDLTIPFARYVAMHHGELVFPFRRYQIQPVWRADRPQKGRYREFYQCDADVVGSHSLLMEAELAALYGDVFERLGLAVEIRLNSRHLLAALAEACGAPGRLIDITIAIDKLDKIGLEKVKEELLDKEFNHEQLALIQAYLSIQGSNAQKLRDLGLLLGNQAQAERGIQEIQFVLARLPALEATLRVDATLARGLNYYTGIIFEVRSKEVVLGSLGGGGRYDDLTGLFGVPGTPGVGISFGLDRIYDVLEELKRFPQAVQTQTKVLFFNLGELESAASFTLMQQLRKKGVACELYHESSKFDKQFKYAEKKNIPFAVIVGGQELEEGTCMIRDLKKGQQVSVSQTELLSYSF